MEVGLQRKSFGPIFCSKPGTISQKHKWIPGKEEISWYLKVKYNYNFTKMEVDHHIGFVIV